MEKRFNWAIDRKDWKKENWNKIMFSDESQINPKPLGILYVRKKNSEMKMDAKFCNLIKRKKISILVWGCICAEGPVDLVWIHETITGDIYQTEILEQRVKTYKFLENEEFFSKIMLVLIQNEIGRASCRERV